MLTLEGITVESSPSQTAVLPQQAQDEYACSSCELSLQVDHYI
jgi:hypothetical protein